MPKVVSKGNDKYGGDCDGGFSQLTGGCIYHPKKKIFDVKNVTISVMIVAKKRETHKNAFQ